MAILVRSNHDADQFLRSLNLRGIPWTFSGNQGLYGRPEVRLLIAFLRAVAHPDDSVSVHYVASSDLYQVPIVDLTRCATYADRRHRWLFDVLRRAGEIPELGGEISEEGQVAIRRLVADLTRYMELARELPTGELLYQFLVDSGWLARMSKAATARDEAEVQNISRFFRRVQDAAQAPPLRQRARVREPPRRPHRRGRGSGRGGGRHRDPRRPRPHRAQGQGAGVPRGVPGEPRAGKISPARAPGSPGGSRGTGQVRAARGRLPPARGAPGSSTWE